MKANLSKVAYRFALVALFCAATVGVGSAEPAKQTEISSMIDGADEMVIKYAPARWLERSGLVEAELSENWFYRVGIRCIGGCRRAAPTVVSFLDRAQRANVECSQNFVASIEFRTKGRMNGVILVHVTEECLSFDGKGYRVAKGALKFLETLPITHW